MPLYTPSLCCMTKDKSSTSTKQYPPEVIFSFKIGFRQIIHTHFTVAKAINTQYHTKQNSRKNIFLLLFYFILFLY